MASSIDLGSAHPSPRRGVQLLVARTAGAVSGAVAGGAVALGAGLPAMPTTALGGLGALLGAVSAASGARRQPSPTD